MSTPTNFSYTDILNAWEADAELDLGHLDHESRNIPRLHAKYWKYLRSAHSGLKKLERDYAALKLLKMQWMLGKLDEDVRKAKGWEPFQLRLIQSQVDPYLDADTDLQAIQAKRDAQAHLVKCLEDIIKQINGRGFHVKNALDFMRISKGEL